MLGTTTVGQKRLVAMSIRYSSGHHHFKRQEFISKADGIKYEIPVDKKELELEYGTERGIFEDRLFRKLSYYFRTHRDSIVDNIRTNKYSAYYWLPRLQFFRSRSLLSLLAHLFEKGSSKQPSIYNEPTKIHENSVFLYKAPNSSFFMSMKLYDYVALSFIIYGTLSAYPLMWFPAAGYLAEFPKFMIHNKYYTMRADLLPHSEQVVFTKGGFFFRINQTVVDIKNLDKVSADTVKGAQFMFR
jgi:hypothetical protein